MLRHSSTISDALRSAHLALLPSRDGRSEGPLQPRRWMFRLRGALSGRSEPWNPIRVCST